ncbi:GntR family transcriptional regulator [Phototrophicus methaneseepsis]|uniref:GntR family transcriptional regulator n=1 Tax=Phototrophicus methaneseepsis TaxID=2710758 RepID=A0A7S8E599_9CHLR|nr:GntR family transcriptional regulator [Phototrophicus methaneseepsis]QPC80642.1 GntR family transcriptional regulator [Phototrophicus methaneseepsis]
MMPNNHSSKPLYEQIKDDILYRIQSGEYAPNTQLPSERQLAAKFGVSRLTASKAIKALIQAGWLYVQIGKGTYVREKPIDQEIAALTSFSEEMASRGQQVASKILRAEVTTPPGEIARALRVSVAMDVIVLERVRYVARRPVALELAYILAAKCPGILEKHDFTRESLYSVLANDYQIHLTYAEQTFEARSAQEHEAHHLKIPIGTPVLAISRVTYNSEDAPIEVVKSMYLSDRYKFRAILRRS